MNSHFFVEQNHQETLGEIVVSQERIIRRVGELGNEISRDYEGRSPLLVGVLKGAAFFAADLARHVSLPVGVDWIRASTYGMGDTTDGTVRILGDVSQDPAGRDVILVEDIVDSGLTLHHLVSHFKGLGADSVEICSLLRKPKSLRHPVQVEYVGFDIDVHWVAGNGIDYADRHRNLPDIREVRTG
ncbi:hypoxanthine phosphoribosyltransferase [Allosalinactinospora lopnorensis]|uniref:hypoxanthine phosphoribosyltransferase n=1 Tax=Allosalinactinospora lopnorensis TaxID=1352348 RepID=UPI000623E9BD|nr:hypoxanthine phosphoribosyltransferase [Allosalinactinospora lopnorensis]